MTSSSAIVKTEFANRGWVVTILCLLLGGSTFWLYSPVRNHEFVLFDDNMYVYENEHVQDGLQWESIQWAFSNFGTGIWHPITWLSHMSDYELYGIQNPGGHHLTSASIHAATTGLLFVLLYVSTGRVWPCLIVAVLFGWHPLRVESVAWASERKDQLSAFFWIATMLCYVWWTRSPSRGRYLLVSVAFVVGLMCKPMLVTLPVVLVLFDIWPLRRLQFDAGGLSNAIWPRVREKLPLFIAAGIFSIIAYAAQAEAGALAEVSYGMRLSHSLVAIAVYVRDFLWPANLACFYPRASELPSASLLILTAAALATISVYSIRVLRVWPILLVGWFWFLISLLPVLGLVSIGDQSHADRYTYIPSIGLCMIAGWGLTDLVKSSKPARYGGTVLLAIVAVVLAGRTRDQLATWENSETLFEHAIATAKPCQFPHNNLAIYLYHEGRAIEAEQHYLAALEFDSDNVRTLTNLGCFYRDIGKMNKAVETLQLATKQEPVEGMAQIALGGIYSDRGDFYLAQRVYEQALARAPGANDVRYQLAVLLKSQGMLAPAREHLLFVLDNEPSMVLAHVALGDIEAQLGDLDGAMTEYREALSLEPDFAYAEGRLGTVLSAAGMHEEGAALLHAAIQEDNFLLMYGPTYIELLLRSSDPNVHNPLLAVEIATRLCRLDNSLNPHSLELQAISQIAAGQFAEARIAISRAIEVATDSPEDVGTLARLKELEAELLSNASK